MMCITHLSVIACDLKEIPPDIQLFAVIYNHNAEKHLIVPL